MPPRYSQKNLERVEGGRAYVRTLDGREFVTDVDDVREEYLLLRPGIQVPYVDVEYVSDDPEEMDQALRRAQTKGLAAVRAAGRSALQAGDLAAAEAFFTQVILGDPTDKHGWLARGRTRILLDRPDDALADLECALDLDPNHAEGYALEAEVALRGERWERARELAEKALSLRAQSVEALLAFAQACIKGGDAAAARPALDKAMELSRRLERRESVRARELLAEIDGQAQGGAATAEQVGEWQEELAGMVREAAATVGAQIAPVEGRAAGERIYRLLDDPRCRLDLLVRGLEAFARVSFRLPLPERLAQASIGPRLFSRLTGSVPFGPLAPADCALLDGRILVIEAQSQNLAASPAARQHAHELAPMVSGLFSLREIIRRLPEDAAAIGTEIERLLQG